MSPLSDVELALMAMVAVLGTGLLVVFPLVCWLVCRVTARPADLAPGDRLPSPATIDRNLPGRHPGGQPMGPPLSAAITRAVPVEVTGASLGGSTKRALSSDDIRAYSLQDTGCAWYNRQSILPFKVPDDVQRGRPDPSGGSHYQLPRFTSLGSNRSLPVAHTYINSGVQPWRGGVSGQRRWRWNSGEKPVTRYNSSQWLGVTADY